MSWIQTAKVGDKIVCINVEQQAPYGVVLIDVPRVPTVGQVYTIREILVGVVGKTPCVRLVEIEDQSITLKIHGKTRVGDLVFEAAGFRPVRKTDISVFTDMLKIVPAFEEA